jgi:uncharacterized membrane protein YbhN (UPF0104 family)
VWLAGPEKLWTTAQSADPFWFAIAASVLVPWFVFGIVNVWLLLRRLAEIDLRTFADVYAASWTSALFLPGQLGDATQVLLLRRHGIPLAASTAAYAADKLVSLGFMLAVACTGAVRHGHAFSEQLHRPSLLVPLLGLAGAGLAIVVLFGMLSRQQRFGRLRAIMSRGRDALLTFAREPRLLLANLTITIVKWLLMMLSYTWAFRAFGVRVSLIDAATIPIMSSLVGYLPVSVGGLGTTEWTAVALFRSSGVAEAVVLAVFLLLRTSVILVAVLLLAVVHNTRPSVAKP